LRVRGARPRSGPRALAEEHLRGGNGSYVEIADLGTAVAVRDSKDPDGPKLILTTGQWRSFTDSIKAGNHHP
jgi:hypothetical protein